MEEKRINNAAIEIIRLTAEMDMTPKEALEAVMKAMHFIIEKGFCQTEAKTTELITKAMGQFTMATTIIQN